MGNHFLLEDGVLTGLGDRGRGESLQLAFFFKMICLILQWEGDAEIVGI